MCVIMAALVRASKSFEMTEPWLFKQNSGMQSQGRSRWNILSGTGAAGAFCVERGSYPKLLYFPGTGVRAAHNFACFASMPRMRPGSDSHQSAGDQNRSRQDILPSLGAQAAADTFPHSYVGIWAGITLSSCFKCKIPLRCDWNTQFAMVTPCPITWEFLPQDPGLLAAPPPGGGMGRLAPGVWQDTSFAAISEISSRKRIK